jgi:hypothetical protein
MGVGHETRIRELEKRFGAGENDIRTLRRQVTAVREGVRDYWIDGGAPVTGFTTVAGTIYGGRLVGFAGATVRIVGHTTGIVYGTATANGSGVYSLDLILKQPDISSGVARVDGYTDYPTGGRLDGTVQIDHVNLVPFADGATNVFDLKAGVIRGVVAATGYTFSSTVAVVGPCDFPIATGLDTTDSGNPGTFTSTGTGSWSGTHTGVTYTLIWDDVNVEWHLIVSTSGVTWVATTWTCPDPASSVKFSVTFVNVIVGGRTVTFAEP